MNCRNCGQQLSPQRLAAMPGETWCKACVEASGDVQRVKGVMIYDHKTAPTLATELDGTDVDAILRHSRRGAHAQLPMASKRRAEATRDSDLENLSLVLQTDSEVNTLEVTNRIPARCHPSRFRVTPAGLCIDCAKEWYEERLKK